MKFVKWGLLLVLVGAVAAQIVHDDKCMKKYGKTASFDVGIMECVQDPSKATVLGPL